MAETLTPDICVIGAGSGGLTVAAAAAAFGVPVVLIEHGEMGGDCLNYGCVPSKALIAAGKHAHAIRQAPQFGVMADAGFEVDFAAVHRHIHEVIASIAPNDSQERFTALGVRVIRDTACFTDKDTVKAGDCTIRARRFVVATGSSALVPPIDGLDKTPYLTNETIFDNKKLPARLIIIGGGPIGVELAQAHHRLGSQVTVLEAQTALGKDDPELAAIVLARLRGEGIDIREDASVKAVGKAGRSGVRVTAEIGGKEVVFDGTHLLVAAGRAPNVKGLGLEAAGVKFDRKGIKVDAALRTTNRRVYAIGDVAGSLQFTHVAGYHAGLVVRSILFRWAAKPDTSIIPWVTFTDPELAHVGMDEKTARDSHSKINVLRWPLTENDRAQTERQTAGLIKVITTANGRILGATICGANAGEMIHLWALAVSKKMSVRDITGYVAPYPTFGEIGRRAAVAYYTPMTRKPWLRGVIAFLRKFG